MKVTDTVYIHWQKYQWEEVAAFRVKGYKDETSPDCVFIREEKITFEVPDDFDPVPRQIDMLRAAKAKIQADTQIKINNIEEQIQSLLAIEDKSK